MSMTRWLNAMADGVFLRWKHRRAGRWLGLAAFDTINLTDSAAEAGVRFDNSGVNCRYQHPSVQKSVRLSWPGLFAAERWIQSAPMVS